MVYQLKNKLGIFCKDATTPEGHRPAGLASALWTLCSLFIFILGISFPSFLSIPSKSRESGGIVVDTSEQHKEVTCLINTLYAEARSEPEEGIRAVMSVIYNRKNHKNYPNTFCKVILQDKQFSAFNSDKSLATKRLKPVKGPDEEAYTKVAGIAQEAVVGAFEPVLKPSVLHYAHIKVKNKWTKRMQAVKIAGRHVFYKEI
jgi:spore germination cell wall hydrolase CwlJ-like protein